MNVLVTGGAGFCGSNLAERLYHLGHKVSILDDLSEGSLNNLSDLPFLFYPNGDILEVNLDRVVRDVDVIYHLACSKMIYSIDNPEKDIRVNALGTLRLLEAVRKSGNTGCTVVYTSTGSVYGNASVIPTKEDSTLRPESPYGVSKWMAEEYCRLYSRLYGLKTVILRLHSVYGPRQKFTIGVIPKFIDQVLMKRPLTIEGDGRQGRAFTYVDDCVDALLLAAEKGIPGEAYNLSGGRTYSIDDIAKFVVDLVGSDPGRLYVPRKKGDLEITGPDISKLKALGWEPKTDILTGINDTAGWMKNWGTKQ